MVFFRLALGKRMVGVVEQTSSKKEDKGKGDGVKEKSWRRWVDLRGWDSTVDADMVEVFSAERFSQSRLSTETLTSSLSVPFLATLCGAVTFGDTGKRGIDTSTQKGTHGFNGNSVVRSIHSQADCKMIGTRSRCLGQGTRVRVLKLRQQ